MKCSYKCDNQINFKYFTSALKPEKVPLSGAERTRLWRERRNAAGFHFADKEKDRKRKENRNSNSSHTQSWYRISKALGKQQNVWNAACPRKARKVVHAFPMLPQSPNISNHRNTTTNALVKDFYICDDISWMAAGHKDFLVICNINREMEIHQKRFMLMTLKEAYHYFQEKLPGVKCGFSHFCALRPVFVIYLGDLHIHPAHAGTMKM